MVPVNRNITRQLEHNALMGIFLLSTWVYCRSCACDIDVHIKRYSTSQKGETCFTWYSHSAVFIDPVYSGWTPWLAAREEAEDTVGVLSGSRQTIVHRRQWCHNIKYHDWPHAPPKVGDIVRTTSACLDQLEHFLLLVLIQIGRDGSQRKSPNLVSSDVLLPFYICLVTIWYPYCKGKSFLCSQILVHTAFLIKMLL